MTRPSRVVALLLMCWLTACLPAPATPTPVPATPVPTSAPTAQPRPTAPPPITQVPVPTPRPSALVLWVVADPSQLDPLRTLVNDISASLHIEVAVVGKSASALVTDIRADALGGLPPPDLVWASEEELGFLQRDGMIQPADDQIDAGAFLPAVIDSATIDGQRWGTPLTAQGFLLLLYNRRLVEAAPRTTDELIAQSRRLSTGDQYGLVAGWAEPRWFVPWLDGFGGAAVAADGTPTLNTPQMLAALNLLKELRVSGPPTPSTYTAGARLFRQGRAAFAIDGDWALANYRNYTDTLDLAVAPMPVIPATGKLATPALGGSFLMYGRALAGTPREQARALATALTQPAAQGRIARDLTWLPALRAALTDQEVTANPVLAAAAAQTADAPNLAPSVGLHCAWRAIGLALPDVLMGNLKQEDAAQQMQTSADACMK